MEKTLDGATSTANVNDTNCSALTFDNLTVLKEIGNIANLVREDDFLDTVPKAKLKRVKWMQMFNCLKQGILDDMVQELNSMWEFENMPEKILALEKQKEKFSDTDTTLWRPQLADVKAQLKARDAHNLQKQKQHLTALAKEYEVKVNKLKKTVSAKRGYLKVLQLEIQKCQKKNDEFIVKINDKLEKHDSLAEILVPKTIDMD